MDDREKTLPLADGGRLRGRRVLLAVPLVVVLVTSLVSLGVVFWLGRLVRPASDDWCQTSIVHSSGVGGLISFYWAHDSGRAGNALVTGLVQSTAHGRNVFPGLLLVAGAVALFLATSAVVRRLGRTVPRLVIAAVSVSFVAAVFVREGRSSEGVIYQSLLWTPSATVHTVPFVLSLLLLPLAMWLRDSRWLPPGLVLLFLVCGLLATMTEIYPLILIGWLGLVFLARRVHRYPLGRLDALLVVAGGGLVAGAVALSRAPAFRARAGSRPLSLSILRAAAHAEPTLLHRVFLHPWVLLPILGGVLLGAAGADRVTARMSAWAALAWSGLAVVIAAGVGSFLTAAGDLSAYGELFGRTWIDFMAASGLASLVASAVATYLVTTRVPRWRRLPARSGLLLASLAVAAVTVTLVHVQWVHLHSADRSWAARAAAWDRQDIRIRRAALAGAGTVGYVNNPVAGLSEPFTPSGRPTFVLNCVEGIYRVRVVHSTTAGRR